MREVHWALFEKTQVASVPRSGFDSQSALNSGVLGISQGSP